MASEYNHKKRFWHKCFAERKVDRTIGKSIFDFEEKVVRGPGVGYANFPMPFVLEIDASHSRLGAVLSQEQERLRRPFAHASQGLHPAERNMSN